jgi:hypothetical protein
MKQQTTTQPSSSGPMWQRLEACVREQVQQFITHVQETGHQAHGGPQLQGLGLLLTGERECLLHTGLRLRLVCYTNCADRLAHPRRSWNKHRIFRVLGTQHDMYNTTGVRPFLQHRLGQLLCLPSDDSETHAAEGVLF